MTTHEYRAWCAARGVGSVLAAHLGSDTVADRARAEIARARLAPWRPEVYGAAPAAPSAAAVAALASRVAARVSAEMLPALVGRQLAARGHNAPAPVTNGQGASHGA